MRYLVSMILCVAVLGDSAQVRAQEFRLEGQIDGAFVARDIRVELMDTADRATGTSFWEGEFEKLRSNYLRIHLTDIQVLNGDFEIKISDRNLDIVQTITENDLINKTELWTNVILGSYGLITLIYTQQTMLKFRVDGFVYQNSGGLVLSITDPDEREHIADYPDDPVIQRSARSVAKLSYIKNLEPYVCTGFMIGDDLMMTNNHCVADQTTCDTAVAIFDYQWDLQQKRFRNGEQYKCLSIQNSSYPHDFTVLKLENAPGTKWGHLEFAVDDPQDQQDLLIIGHPAGQPKQVSKKGCKVLIATADGRVSGSDFAHGCDTLGGSSGSPVLNLAGDVVGLHHYGFGQALYWNTNRAIKGSLLKP